MVMELVDWFGVVLFLLVMWNYLDFDVAKRHKLEQEAQEHADKMWDEALEQKEKSDASKTRTTE